MPTCTFPAGWAGVKVDTEPFAISAIVTGVAWKWLMNPSSGINSIFDLVGLKFLENKWFADQNIGIAATAIAAAWQMSGYTMALYLAGLRGISGDLRDAASRSVFVGMGTAPIFSTPGSG